MRSFLFSILLIISTTISIVYCDTNTTTTTESCLIVPCQDIQSICIVKGTNNFNCTLDSKDISINISELQSYLDSTNNMNVTQYQIQVSNHGQDILKRFQLKPLVPLKYSTTKTFWNIDIMPNGDLVLPNNKYINPGQTFNFGIILKDNGIKPKLSIKSLSY
ncbi:hypothetical protein DFA_09820 [Cavenderia fasciculata]|uniref:Carbohydrate binding domain-containing protein n=1 Tax=Cavenderia fasciculata TaxID=261658 RepID=F4QAU1_CACFS|nr:uncharacterized protein DFA_09820 [Cavenderia fasciculata]EGG15000.1 hypothetical protein DFA_09820 [Cavenderia fasciculata]|eukprot:XP_004351720.1 hypothetical protein DFA_09820 [Cavenderia fasciculata]